MPNRYEARELALKDVSLSMGARLLYNALDNFQRLGPECWPSQKTLREIVGCCPRSLRYYLAELVEAGLCVSSRRGYGQSNSYVLHWGNQVPHSEAMDCPIVRQPVASDKANQALKPEIQGASAERQKPVCPHCANTGYRAEEKPYTGKEAYMDPTYTVAVMCECRKSRVA